MCCLARSHTPSTLNDCTFGRKVHTIRDQGLRTNRRDLTMSKVFRFSPKDNLAALLSRNKTWAAKLNKAEPGCLPALADGQAPSILWIGCGDSRVSEACLDLLPGEVFTHRNVANIVAPNDLSSQSVLQYAVQVVGVQHVLVVGHTDCGGVKACLSAQRNGLVDYWLKSVREIRNQNEAALAALPNETARVNALVELNVVAQVKNVLNNENVQDAMKNRSLQVHGLVYNSGTGLLKEVDVPSAPEPVFVV